MPTAATFNLASHFLRREMSSRYLGSFSGGLWALLQPLIQLAVYGFVWAYVFKMVPPGGVDAPGIVPFLALGVWPWSAFSEALSRSTTAIQDNAALIGKVAMPRAILVLSSVASSFLLNAFGFVAILLVLRLGSPSIRLEHLPFALLGLLQLFLLSLGFAFLFSAVQVFVRDLSQTLTQLLPLWMFAGPVLYPREYLPQQYRHWLDWNPFTFYPEFMRAVLLGSGQVAWDSVLIALLVALVVLGIGYSVFRRLSSHFEDFL